MSPAVVGGQETALVSFASAIGRIRPNRPARQASGLCFSKLDALERGVAVVHRELPDGRLEALGGRPMIIPTRRRV